ncbi:unnamed protein product [Cyprideis torosa]|uniref:Uncharacterized protein n=1 Tax=Cyprideis torosa TaxID=163714 RepID=A0A7R8ZR47_9CRUS|nr:unnamed protein product [Cyprideis torosa]CAG0892167.1 unnamed protein product [Cyprideis torosa]
MDFKTVETKKENIQPLKKGHVKSAVLESSCFEEPELRRKRCEFVKLLRSCEDLDDPLEPWYQYIIWTEQHYPRGSKDGKLDQLLEKCIKKFKTSLLYKEDQRFIRIYLNFAFHHQDPEEVYYQMFTFRIGLECADLYKAWSWELERLKSTGAAMGILNRGIRHSYRLKEELEAALEALMARIRRGTDPALLLV